jgi:hypothetical protein
LTRWCGSVTPSSVCCAATPPARPLSAFPSRPVVRRMQDGEGTAGAGGAGSARAAHRAGGGVVAALCPGLRLVGGDCTTAWWTRAWRRGAPDRPRGDLLCRSRCDRPVPDQPGVVPARARRAVGIA